MKTIISGKRYDTETAEEIAYFDNGLGSSNFNYIRETIYRTKSGSWFLFGEGGPNSRYYKLLGNMMAAGHHIIPKTEEEIIDWFGRHNKLSELEIYLPDRLIDA